MNLGKPIKPLPVDAPTRGSLPERLVQARPDWTDQEVMEMEAFLSRCLAVYPAERPKAETFMDDEWYAHVEWVSDEWELRA